MSNVATVTIHVAPVNDPPVLEFDPAAPVDEGSAPVTLHAHATDVDSEQLVYSWQTSIGSIEPGSDGSAHFTADDGPASATVTATASDGDAYTEVTQVIEVRNIPPAVTATAPVRTPWGAPVRFGGDATDPSAADRAAGFRARWSFDDGSTADAPTATHAFDALGAHSAKLSVSDKDGGTSEATATITVERRATQIRDLAPTLFAVGVVNLSARLVDSVDPTTAHLAGRRLELSAGGLDCSATTDQTGLAQCKIDAAQAAPGPTTASARFAGDDRYAPANSSATALAYAWLQAGAFVIGPPNANPTVTFWHPQWFTLNLPAAKSPPTPFKGYADTATRSCHGTWTTRPGASSKPPASLPTFMPVLVSGSVATSGSAISGDIIGIVIVKTHAGYSPSPGHNGTGTIVATRC